MGILALTQPKRALFVVPATVRPNWVRLLQSVFPERAVGSITEGRSITTGSKPAKERRAAQYACDWQVVSYDLAHEVDTAGWDFIVFDEVHNLRSPKSKQTKRARELVWSCPNAECLGLSGTLIPNEAKQLWPQLDCFFPNEWGLPKPKTGDGSWDFEGEFCIRETTSHGTIYRGLRADRAERLRARLEPVVHAIVEKDFAAFIPPIGVEALYVDKQPKDKVKFALDWARDTVAEGTTFGVFTHLRETAHAVAAAMAERYPKLPLYVFTGEQSSEVRYKMLQRSYEDAACIIVGTTHALREGISLEHVKSALLLEWVTELVQVTQFIPRFTPITERGFAGLPPRLDFVIGPNDERRLAALKARVDAANMIFTAGRAEEAIALLSTQREMSDEEFISRLTSLADSLEQRSDFSGLVDLEGDDDE